MEIGRVMSEVLTDTVEDLSGLFRRGRGLVRYRRVIGDTVGGPNRRQRVGAPLIAWAVSYTHLTLPTN